MKTDEHTIGKWISILYRYGQNYISKRLEPYNIGSGQYIFLMHLYKNDGISQENLSDKLKMDKATTAKALKKLEEEGYINREIDCSDKRAYQIFITPKALEIRQIIHATIKSWEEILSRGLSKEETDMVNNILKKMAENAAGFHKTGKNCNSG